ncbi:MAG: cob(I)yrinic acid a,c-diamide adenosyltransferase [Spirochaetaceae bacterium]|jgi:cob(I)alamin adenosyltransferase|nr:cob(I)yrinic acid a,c-diamide adenosyltransferase [Spirochaetaceae bacterium]
MIHVYTGDGKGKTTAAVGLAVRAAGSGGKVVFAQFIKSMPSGELAPLEKLGITVIRSRTRFGFTFQMDAATKELCGNEQRRILDDAAAAVRQQGAAMLVLDEVLDALGAAVLDEDSLRALLRSPGIDCEIVLTGRPVPDWLAEAADYHSHVKKIKHPFDRGVKARDGIER